ncbi:hypothetical protein ZWY2020_008895 [Hordeum vulgare]|nr:hypothetical protein ZWY2020_008895 [Hordeum vulgare]
MAVPAGFIFGAAAAAVIAVGAYMFFWPASAVVMMKAPGSGGLLISRLAFEANPQRYYHLLRTAGAAVAAAAFAPHQQPSIQYKRITHADRLT